MTSKNENLVFAMVKDGQLRTVKRGRRSGYSMSELDELRAQVLALQSELARQRETTLTPEEWQEIYRAVQRGGLWNPPVTLPKLKAHIAQSQALQDFEREMTEVVIPQIIADRAKREEAGRERGDIPLNGPEWATTNWSLYQAWRKRAEEAEAELNQLRSIAASSPKQSAPEDV